MNQSLCTLLTHQHLQGDYYRMRLDAPEICRAAQPGQFVHLIVPELDGHILRRPFSICDVNGDTLTIVYKAVGAGTNAMTKLKADGTTALDVIGPLGHGFANLPADRPAFLLGGGYGCAAMLFTAHKAVASGLAAPTVLLGARSSADILLAEEFKALGCEVQLATDDGSAGVHGRITALLEPALQSAPEAWVAACGPKPMLRAVAQLTERFPGCGCEVSLDAIMCCGVGACFGCVIKCKAANANGWEYRRSCKEGPVFPAQELYFGD